MHASPETIPEQANIPGRTVGSDEPKRRSPRVLYLLLALYLLILAFIAFWPTPIDAGIAPFLHRMIGFWRAHGLFWLTYSTVEFGANVLLFVAPGFLITRVLPGRVRWLAPSVCLLAAAGIELAQLWLLDARASTTADVVANTLGGLIGYIIATMFARARSRSARSRIQ